MRADDDDLEMKVENIANRMLVVERQVSDQKYAVKLVETIVFGAIGLILVAVVGALIALVVKGSPV